MKLTDVMKSATDKELKRYAKSMANAIPDAIALGAFNRSRLRNEKTNSLYSEIVILLKDMVDVVEAHTFKHVEYDKLNGYLVEEMANLPVLDDIAIFDKWKPFGTEEEFAVRFQVEDPANAVMSITFAFIEKSKIDAFEAVNKDLLNDAESNMGQYQYANRDSVFPQQGVIDEHMDGVILTNPITPLESYHLFGYTQQED